jgi:hypothetical protein
MVSQIEAASMGLKMRKGGIIAASTSDIENLI